MFLSYEILKILGEGDEGGGDREYSEVVGE